MINSFPPFFINQTHLIATQRFVQQEVSHEVVSFQPKAEKYDNIVSQAHLAAGKMPSLPIPHSLLSLENPRLENRDSAQHSHFTEEKIETQKGEWTCLRSQDQWEPKAEA